MMQKHILSTDTDVDRHDLFLYEHDLISGRPSCSTAIKGVCAVDLLFRTDVEKHMQEKIGSDEGRRHVALGEAHLHLLRVESIHLTTHSRHYYSRCCSGVGCCCGRLFLSCVRHSESDTPHYHHHYHRSSTPLPSIPVSASRHQFYPLLSSLHRKSYQRRSGVAPQAVAGLRIKKSAR